MAEHTHFDDMEPVEPFRPRVPAPDLAALLPVLARADSALGCPAPVLLRVVRGDGTAWERWLTGVEVDWVDGVVTLVAGDGEPSTGDLALPLAEAERELAAAREALGMAEHCADDSAAGERYVRALDARNDLRRYRP